MKKDMRSLQQSLPIRFHFVFDLWQLLVEVVASTSTGADRLGAFYTRRGEPQKYAPIRKGVWYRSTSRAAEEYAQRNGALPPAEHKDVSADQSGAPSADTVFSYSAGVASTSLQTKSVVGPI